MEKIDWKQIRSIDMVDYLSRLGIEPKKIKGNEFWYYSPFREEKTPSFKVDRVKNVWFDWGEGIGGNIIDFAIRHHGCTVGEFLKSLEGTLQMLKPGKAPKIQEENQSIIIISERSLWSYPLLGYLKKRNIPIAIADQYCREIRYLLNGKEYYGIGFKNNLGGYEIRNTYFKTSCSPKGITHIDNGSKEICVFEGFFDFLSFCTLNAHLPKNNFDYLILNSLSFFEQSRIVMEYYAHIHLYLDSDNQGQKFTAYALSLDKRYIDESSLYKHYKDLNNFHCRFGMKPSLGQKEEQQKMKKFNKGL